MAKSSLEFRQQAAALLAKAQEIEEQEYFKIGKIVLEFYKKGAINDEALKKAIDNFYNGTTEKKRGRKKLGTASEEPGKVKTNIFNNNSY